MEFRSSAFLIIYVCFFCDISSIDIRHSHCACNSNEHQTYVCVRVFLAQLTNRQPNFNRTSNFVTENREAKQTSAKDVAEAVVVSDFSQKCLRLQGFIFTQSALVQIYDVFRRRTRRFTQSRKT